MSVVYIMIGIVGSGKSTWARKKAKEDSLTVIANKDSFRSMIKGEKNYVFDNIYEPTIQRVTDKYILYFIKQGFDVIIDETCFSKRRRKYYVDLLRKETDSAIIFVHCTEARKNLARRMRDPRGYDRAKWKSVIATMSLVFDPIEENEGYDSLIVV